MTSHGRIIIASGGTGGHVFPATVLGDELLSRGYEVVFATDKRGLKYLGKFADAGIVQNIKTKSRPILYITLLYNTLIALCKIIKLRPNLIVGFGGYPSVPFVLAGQLLKYKTIIHEQNAVIGKANLLLSKFATMILTSFQNTLLLKLKKNVQHVGNPSRFENVDFIPRNQAYTRKKILVFGGSQGSKIFADTIQSAIIELSKSREIEVFHQCRVEDLKRVQDSYNNAKIKNTVSPFFEDMDKKYQEADIIISRSGASSIFEIIHFGKPAILIPFARSINGDQLANARYLSEHKAAFVIEESVLNQGLLLEKLQIIIDNTKLYETFAKNLKELEIKNTTKKFADTIENMLYYK